MNLKLAQPTINLVQDSKKAMAKFSPKFSWSSHSGNLYAVQENNLN